MADDGALLPGTEVCWNAVRGGRTYSEQRPGSVQSLPATASVTMAEEGLGTSQSGRDVQGPRGQVLPTQQAEGHVTGDGRQRTRRAHQK